MTTTTTTTSPHPIRTATKDQLRESFHVEIGAIRSNPEYPTGGPDSRSAQGRTARRHARIARNSGHTAMAANFDAFADRHFGNHDNYSGD